jgi:hypothetical protein
LTGFIQDAYLYLAMPSALRQRLNELASSFASNVLQAIRSASLDDVLAESGGRRGTPRAVAKGAGPRRSERLPRRSSEDIERMIDRIVGLLRKHPEGMRAEDIRQHLGIEAKELPRPLKQAVASGRLGKSGHKRATTYFLEGGAAARSGAGRRARKRGAARGNGRGVSAKRAAAPKRARKVARKAVAKRGPKGAAAKPAAAAKTAAPAPAQAAAP